MPQHGGPTVLREGDVRDARLPGELRTALREWADVAETVIRSGDADEVDLLRRRGRQLASRAAEALGRPVEFVDPVSGSVESILGATARAGTATNGAVRAPAAVDGVPADGVVVAGGGVTTGGDAGAAGHTAAATNGVVARSAGAIAPRQTLEPPGPTPWGTGTAVAAFFAVVVALADVVLANAFAGAFGLLWIPANLLVTVGTVPSLWLAREVPFWRWPALGAAVGLAAAWVVMLLALLGS